MVHQRGANRLRHRLRLRHPPRRRRGHAACGHHRLSPGICDAHDWSGPGHSRRSERTSSRFRQVTGTRCDGHRPHRRYPRGEHRLVADAHSGSLSMDEGRLADRRRCLRRAHADGGGRASGTRCCRRWHARGLCPHRTHKHTRGRRAHVPGRSRACRRRRRSGRCHAHRAEGHMDS